MPTDPKGRSRGDSGRPVPIMTRREYREAIALGVELYLAKRPEAIRDGLLAGVAMALGVEWLAVETALRVAVKEYLAAHPSKMGDCLAAGVAGWLDRERDVVNIALYQGVIAWLDEAAKQDPRFFAKLTARAARGWLDGSAADAVERAVAHWLRVHENEIANLIAGRAAGG